MKMREVYVGGIALDREREFPVVLIRSDEDDEVMPIWIGAAEATAIYSVLAGTTFDRPMTHDLLKLVVEELGGEVRGIEITGIHEDTYFARIVLARRISLWMRVSVLIVGGVRRSTSGWCMIACWLRPITSTR